MLGCLTPVDAGRAAERIGLPVLVCEDLRGGIEVLCGVVRDPQAGPLVVSGVGGSLAEALAASVGGGARAARARRGRALVRSCGPLGGALDEPAQHAVADVLVALGRLAAHRPEVAAIDINPLRVPDGGAIALDALIVLEHTAKETQWISP